MASHWICSPTKVIMSTCSLTRICRANISRSAVIYLQVTLPLLHDPNLKKKKKQQLDPQKIARMKEREERRRRNEVIIPPMDPDASPDAEWFAEGRKRTNGLMTASQKEERILLLKEYSRHMMKVHKEDLCTIQERARCRQEAMRELKRVSVFLYEEASKVNRTMFPMTFNGPVETPPIATYLAPEIDTSKAR